MGLNPEFFVPGAKPDEQEAHYVRLASGCHCAPPPLKMRVYAIEFTNDGTDWRAGVGERLTGSKQVLVRVKGKMIEQTVDKSEQVMVVAIFPGNPYVVVTRPVLDGVNGSAWENLSYLTGTPTKMMHFRPPRG